MEDENSMGLPWIFDYPNGSLMFVQDGKLSSCKRAMQSVSSEHLLQWCYLFFDISLSSNKILSDVCKMQQTKIKTTIIVKLFVKENWKLFWISIPSENCVIQTPRTINMKLYNKKSISVYWGYTFFLCLHVLFSILDIVKVGVNKCVLVLVFLWTWFNQFNGLNGDDRVFFYIFHLTYCYYSSAGQ